MPVDIVDELEVVEVEHQHRSQRRRALREQVGNLLLECTAVEQPGEDVMVALMLDAATRLDLMRHVLHEAEHAVVLAAFHHHETNPRGSMRAREEVAALFLHLDVGNVPFIRLSNSLALNDPVAMRCGSKYEGSGGSSVDNVAKNPSVKVMASVS